MEAIGPETPQNPWPADRKLDPPVTIRTFSREDERMPVRAFLEAEGVATFQPDGNVLSIDPGLYVALGFYKLQVPTSQAELAVRLLGEWDDAAPLPENVDTGEWAAAEPPREGAIWPWFAAMASLAALFFLVAALRGG
ncbi:MAG: hypothetical protein KDA24_24405 [Deltaproteobacteria bacterium]|nr:hypothetical protein [Deltaproteobacteria bacterium]